MPLDGNNVLLSPGSDCSRGFRIVVRAPNWIGDLCMATPIFEGLKHLFPGAHLTLLLRPYLKKVVAHNPFIDEVVPVEVDRRGRGILGRLQEGWSLRKKQYDLALCLPNSIGAAIPLWLARVPVRIGYDRHFRHWLLNRTLPSPRVEGEYAKIPMPIYYNALLKLLGAVWEKTRPQLYYTPEEKAASDQILAEQGIVDPGKTVVFLPGAAFGSSKCWPPEYFGELARLVIDRLGFQVAVPLGPGEEEVGRVLKEAAQRPVAVFPMGLDTLKPFIERARLVVANDSGTRQYAVAYHRPLLVFCGPIDPALSAINLEESTLLYRPETICRPCHLKKCPLDHSCLKGILPERAFEEIVALLKKFPS